MRDRGLQSGVAPTGFEPGTRVAEVLRSELQVLGVMDSFAAGIALGLAQQLDGGTVLGAAYVSLSKELDRRVDALRLSAERPDDPALTIRQRVEAKRSQLKLVSAESDGGGR